MTDEHKMEMLNKVLIAERVILQTLAFDLRIVHPIEKLFEKWKSIMKYLSADNKTKLKQNALRFLIGCTLLFHILSLCTSVVNLYLMLYSHVVLRLL